MQGQDVVACNKLLVCGEAGRIEYPRFLGLESGQYCNIGRNAVPDLESEVREAVSIVRQFRR